VTLVLLYSTWPSREAAIAAGRTLVDERLIACANVLDGSTSIYRWDGAVCTENEAVLLAKTSAERADAAQARLIALHSYQVPCVLQLPVHEAPKPYTDWVLAQLTAE
jgi:periplasmic divalent cation tolerance protein